jgi:hypothetical protein
MARLEPALDIYTGLLVDKFLFILKTVKVVALGGGQDD